MIPSNDTFVGNDDATAFELFDATGAFIGPDGVLEVVGSGTVTVVDASHLTHSSMWEATEGQALSLLGLRIDVLGEGCRYDLKARQAYAPDKHAHFCSLPVSSEHGG